jgi:membrane associated rhomboid family serine protease
MYFDYNAVMVGASGAIYGVVVAFAFLFPNSRLMLLFPPIPIKAKYLVPFLILGDLFFGFTSASIGPIAHFAHIGGAITGFLMMWYWKKNQFNNKRWN